MDTLRVNKALSGFQSRNGCCLGAGVPLTVGRGEFPLLGTAACALPLPALAEGEHGARLASVPCWYLRHMYGPRMQRKTPCNAKKEYAKNGARAPPLARRSASRVSLERPLPWSTKGSGWALTLCSAAARAWVGAGAGHVFRPAMGTHWLTDQKRASHVQPVLQHLGPVHSLPPLHNSNSLAQPAEGASPAEGGCATSADGACACCVYGGLATEYLERRTA
mmetsp:Transcript_79131/g.256220  ORF Transcript_79131/g.256220 Transcript_79131/m.256220 type:complete len:221 (+) Transcript_79131:392-1054(+)